MASIPCSPRHSVSGLKDTPNLFENPLVSFVSPPSTPALQYFNIRVTERLHRYRSLRRQWQEVGTPKSPSPMPHGDLSSNPTVELKVFSMSESNSGTMIREHPEKSFVESEALQSRIQQDLIKLRRLIKARQKKLAETGGGNNPPKTRGLPVSSSSLAEQDTLNRMKSSFQMKTSVFPLRPSTFPQMTVSDHSKTASLARQREHLSHPLDSAIQGVSSVKKRSQLPSKAISPARSYRLTLPTTLKKKPLYPLKREFHRSSMAPFSSSDQTTQCSYNYAAPSSSLTPSSMKLRRNTSLLPILLTSSTCVGLQQRDMPRESDPDYYSLLDYKRLLAHLPSPVIARYGDDEDAILLEQLDHIRTTMPDTNVYDDYTRTSFSIK